MHNAYKHCFPAGWDHWSGSLPPYPATASGPLSRHTHSDTSQTTLASVAPVFSVMKLDKEGNILSFAGKFRLTPENIYLLHDELDKSLGKVTLKLGGSARGHNGVRSCIDHLKSDTMIRLLIGIGRPADKSSVTPYVLARFTKNKQETLTLVLEKGLDLLLGHIQKRTQAATSTPITRPVQNRI
ncbi:peptidyl-tRNA hydrolase-like isoform X1 [Dendrobates tinctorius]|uniref:peptidyl-tRNA hydrolase-like isoform X1 n=1 Tax=Dendrobates tinctorius TaxID=92724 RepID=UPI003CC9C13E